MISLGKGNADKPEDLAQGIIGRLWRGESIPQKNLDNFVASVKSKLESRSSSRVTTRANSTSSDGSSVAHENDALLGVANRDKIDECSGRIFLKAEERQYTEQKLVNVAVFLESLATNSAEPNVILSAMDLVDRLY